MKRKEFVQLTGALVTLGVAKGSAQDPVPQAAERRQKVHEAWLKSLLENLDAHVDEPARIKLMESVGRACARRGGMVRTAQAAKGDVNKLVETLAHHVGKENARREGSTVQVCYPKCYCPVVAAGPERLSNTWCHCSRGWLREVFETVTGKPVTVELTHSIKRGDPECRFTIRL
jgi:predicted hydrocarbon binding protein